MNVTTAVSSLQESILQTETELSSLAEQRKEKRAELRRFRKALNALTGDTRKRGSKRSAPAESANG